MKSDMNLIRYIMIFLVILVLAGAEISDEDAMNEYLNKTRGEAAQVMERSNPPPTTLKKVDHINQLIDNYLFSRGALEEELEKRLAEKEDGHGFGGKYRLYTSGSYIRFEGPLPDELCDVSPSEIKDRGLWEAIYIEEECGWYE